MTFSEKRVQFHLSGKRDTQKFWDFVWLYFDSIAASDPDNSLTGLTRYGCSKSQGDTQEDRASHILKNKTSKNSNERE